jgi:hypothetical protein
MAGIRKAGRLQLKKGTQQTSMKAKESVKELRSRFMEMDVEEAQESLSEAEVKKLIVTYAEMTASVKAAGKELKRFKELMVEKAREDEWVTTRSTLPGGHCATVIITPTTETKIGTTREFAQILRDEGKFHLFDELTKVKLTEAKKILGEDALSDFISTDVERYGKVTLKLE